MSDTFATNDERRGRKLQSRFIKEDERSRQAGLGHLIQTFEGRRFLWLFLSEHGPYAGAFSPDPYVHAFQAGQQEPAKKIIEMLTLLFPDTYLQMMKENQDVHHRRTVQLERLTDAPDQPALAGFDTDPDY